VRQSDLKISATITGLLYSSNLFACGCETDIRFDFGVVNFYATSFYTCHKNNINPFTIIGLFNHHIDLPIYPELFLVIPISVISIFCAKLLMNSR